MDVVIYIFAGFGVVCALFLGWAAALDQRDKLRKRRRRRKRKWVVVPEQPVTPPPPPRRPAPLVKARPTPAAPRKSANPNVPRVTCSACNKKVTLTKEGRLRVHVARPRSNMNCRGSSKRYVNYIIHEEEIF